MEAVLGAAATDQEYGRFRHALPAIEGGFLLATSRAEMLLPPELLNEIQKYVQGREIYIPKATENYARWGERSGIRADLAERNRDIVQHYINGASVEELMSQFHLSYDSIRKIIRKSNRRLDQRN
jgi:Mor family transcriptional regulator